MVKKLTSVEKKYLCRAVKRTIEDVKAGTKAGYWSKSFQKLLSGYNKLCKR